MVGGAGDAQARSEALMTNPPPRHRLFNTRSLVTLNHGIELLVRYGKLYGIAWCYSSAVLVQIKGPTTSSQEVS
jgi:hypothetical protein